MSFTQSLQQSKKPSLLPSTGFRAASQLPRYSKFSMAMTTISSPLASKKSRSNGSPQVARKDAFSEERDAVLAHVTALGVAAKATDKEAMAKKSQFLKEEFWKQQQHEQAEALAPPAVTVTVTDATASEPAVAKKQESGNASEGGYLNALPVANADRVKSYLASSGKIRQLDGGSRLRESDTDVGDGDELEPIEVLSGNPLHGYTRVDGEDADEPPVELHNSGHLWATNEDSPEQEARAKSVMLKNGPSFSLSKQSGFQMIDRFHRVVELLNASPAPPVNVQLDCHREMHTLTANFRNDAIMYGRVIISEVALPVEQKTIKPLEASGILGGDKYRVGSVYFKFAVDRLGIFGGADEAACKVAGHELKALVQIMECQIPGLRFPLLCIIDYLGFRLIAMSTLPIKGRQSLIYGSMDGGKTVVTSPQTMEITVKMGKKLNLKEHGLRHQPKTTRVFTPADLELHQGTDGHIYALDFSRMFPPDVAQDNLPGGVFYQLLRPEFVAKHHKPLCSDAWTSFMAHNESAEAVAEIKEAHEALLDLVTDFGVSLEHERPPVDLLMASEKLVNLMHMNGINCRYMGKIWLAAHASPYWRLVLLLEMISRRLKRILFMKLRKSVLAHDSSGVSASVATALKFLNRVFGESEESVKYWQLKVRHSVLQYFFVKEAANPPLELQETIGGHPWRQFIVNAEHGRVLMNDVRAQLLKLLCQKTGLKLGDLTTEALRNNPRILRVENPFDDADLEDLGVTVTYMPIASFSGAKLKRLTAMETSRRAKAYELNMQASRLYMQALRMNPADAQLLRNCAEVEAALGNNVRADEFFRLAMSVDPNDEGTAFKYAIFFDNSLQLHMAEKWYLNALKTLKKPSHRVPVFLTTYADFLLTERRNVTLAQNLYEIVLEKHPNYVQAAHNLAVLLFETNVNRSRALFKIALDNAEDDSRIAIIARSCASFYLAIQEVQQGMHYYQRYKDLKALVSDHPPSLYHATRSIFGPEMNEIREILGPSNQFKVRHLFWDEIDDDDGGAARNGKPVLLRTRLQRNVLRLFQRLQVPCSSEISYITVGSVQTPAWEFDKLDRVAWAKENAEKEAQIGIVLGYQDGNGFQCFEEELQGVIVPNDSLAEESQGWDSFFRVKGFRKTLQELDQHKAMLNVRRRAYLRMWSAVSESFEEHEEEDGSEEISSTGPALRRSAPVRDRSRSFLQISVENLQQKRKDEK